MKVTVTYTLLSALDRGTAVTFSIAAAAGILLPSEGSFPQNISLTLTSDAALGPVSTRHPKPETRNPKPETRKLKP